MDGGSNANWIYFATIIDSPWPPGPLLIDAYLDGDDARQYIYWLTGGSVNAGAATNPIRLVPGGPVASQ